MHPVRVAGWSPDFFAQLNQLNLGLRSLLALPDSLLGNL